MSLLFGPYECQWIPKLFGYKMSSVVVHWQKKVIKFWSLSNSVHDRILIFGRNILFNTSLGKHMVNKVHIPLCMVNTFVC